MAARKFNPVLGGVALTLLSWHFILFPLTLNSLWLAKWLDPYTPATFLHLKTIFQYTFYKHDRQAKTIYLGSSGINPALDTNQIKTIHGGSHYKFPMPGTNIFQQYLFYERFQKHPPRQIIYFVSLLEFNNPVNLFYLNEFNFLSIKHLGLINQYLSQPILRPLKAQLQLQSLLSVLHPSYLIMQKQLVFSMANWVSHTPAAEYYQSGALNSRFTPEELEQQLKYNMPGQNLNPNRFNDPLASYQWINEDLFFNDNFKIFEKFINGFKNLKQPPRIILIEPVAHPLLKPYLPLIQKQRAAFLKKVRAFSAEHQLIFIPAEELPVFGADDYYDLVHLNVQGRQKMTAWINQRIKSF